MATLLVRQSEIWEGVLSKQLVRVDLGRGSVKTFGQAVRDMGRGSVKTFGESCCQPGCHQNKV